MPRGWENLRGGEDSEVEEMFMRASVEKFEEKSHERNLDYRTTA